MRLISDEYHDGVQYRVHMLIICVEQYVGHLKVNVQSSHVSPKIVKNSSFYNKKFYYI